MTFRPFAALLFVLVGCGATFVEPVVPAPTPTNTLIGIGSHGSPNEAALLASMGAKSTRVTYFLHDAAGQPTDTEHDRDMFRSRLADLEGHGLSVLIVVHDFDRDTVQRVLSLTQSFPERTFQILNEADAAGFTGAQYASLMSRIVALTPAAHFVGMGLATADGQAWSRQADTLRIRAFARSYRDASGPTLDAWCVHAYGLPLANAIATRVRAIRRESPSVPIWVTETGTDRSNAERAYGPLTLAKLDTIQSAQAVAAIAAAKANGVARLYFYSLWDNTNDGFGFVRADASTRRLVSYAIQ